jgi:dipeptidyl aminopeptidase/acylaminoacyl peptidase
MLTASAEPTGSIEPRALTASPEPTASGQAPPKTLRTIAEAPDEAANLTVGKKIFASDQYTSHLATYTSDGLTISALLLEPQAPGRHPGVVLVHGFADPADYVTGGALPREQEALARAGYVVLSPDLRGLGTSDPAPDGPPDLDMGSTDDVINAVRALATSGLPTLDGTRLGLLGHSLGGLLVLDVLAAKPGLVKAAAAFAPSGTDLFANMQRYLAPEDPIYQSIVAAHGTPGTKPGYWADVSPRTFVDRVTEPLLIVQGDIDQDVPIEGTRETVAVWQKAGKAVKFVTLKGEDHVFEARWGEAMAAVTAFFAAHLR